MLQQKTYTFPKIGGGEVTKTLAAPTNKRVIEFLDVFGKKSFKDFLNDEGRMEYAMTVMETAVDPEKLKTLLDICLEEGAGDIALLNIDLRISDEVIQDFFDQRSKSLLALLKS